MNNIEDISRKIIKHQLKDEQIEPYLKNQMGFTMAQLWIVINKIPPLDWMIHDPLIQNHNGNTCMMLWIKYAKNKEEIPTWMLHDPWLKNNNDKSSITMWYYYTILPLPEYLSKKPPEIEFKEPTLDELIMGAESGYKKILNPNSKNTILNFCKTKSTKDFYIIPRKLYEKYVKTFEEISEEKFHKTVSKKYIRILDNNVVYYHIYN